MIERWYAFRYIGTPFWVTSGGYGTPGASYQSADNRMYVDSYEWAQLYVAGCNESAEFEKIKIVIVDFHT